jgi:predicted transposase YbfD/YdcC
VKIVKVRENYFIKLVKYMKKVYFIEKLLRKLKDSRVNPTYKTGEVVLIVLLGFLLRTRSFNNLNNMIEADEFRNVLPKDRKIPKIDTIRDTLKVIDIEWLREINKSIIKKTIENKVFENGTIDGLVVGAIDGTKFFGSNKKSCEKCLIKDNHSFHSGAVLSTVGENPKLVIDFEMYKPKIDSKTKDEGELNVSKRLISRVVEEHEKLIDIITYDALACNSKWINHCVELKIDTVVRVKKNNINSVRNIKKEVNKMDEVALWNDLSEYKEVKVYETEFHMDNVEKPLRYVKFSMKYSNKKRSQIMIVTTLLELDLKTLFKIIRARWDIENTIFNNLKAECGLEHCFVHGGNAVEAVISLIFIASNIMQLFYHRRIRNFISTQVELVRLLLKGLYFYRRKQEYLINTS